MPLARGAAAGWQAQAGQGGLSPGGRGARRVRGARLEPVAWLREPTLLASSSPRPPRPLALALALALARLLLPSSLRTYEEESESEECADSEPSSSSSPPEEPCRESPSGSSPWLPPPREPPRRMLPPLLALLREAAEPERLERLEEPEAESDSCVDSSSGELPSSPGRQHTPPNPSPYDRRPP